MATNLKKKKVIGRKRNCHLNIVIISGFLTVSCAVNKSGDCNFSTAIEDTGPLTKCLKEGSG